MYRAFYPFSESIARTSEHKFDSRSEGWNVTRFPFQALCSKPWWRSYQMLDGIFTTAGKVQSGLFEVNSGWEGRAMDVHVIRYAACPRSWGSFLLPVPTDTSAKSAPHAKAEDVACGAQTVSLSYALLLSGWDLPMNCNELKSKR